MSDERKKSRTILWLLSGVLLGLLIYVRVTDAPSPAYGHGQFSEIVWAIVFVNAATLGIVLIWRVIRTRHNV